MARLPRLQRAGEDDAGEEGGGDRAGERAGRGGERPRAVPRPVCRARSEPRPKATPSAKVSWPSASSVTTPAANQSVAQRASAPQRSRTRRSKR